MYYEVMIQFNGKTSGILHEHQVHQTSWARSAWGRLRVESCRTGLECPLSLSWMPHPHLKVKNEIEIEQNMEDFHYYMMEN